MPLQHHCLALLGDGCVFRGERQGHRGLGTVEIELWWWYVSPLGFMTPSEMHAGLCQCGGPEEVQTNSNNWPWATLAPMVLLRELLLGKGRGVACVQMLHNTDLVPTQVCGLGSVCPACGEEKTPLGQGLLHRVL